jgi:hypothetical protein
MHADTRIGLSGIFALLFCDFVLKLPSTNEVSKIRKCHQNAPRFFFSCMRDESEKRIFKLFLALC